VLQRKKYPRIASIVRSARQELGDSRQISISLFFVSARQEKRNSAKDSPSPLSGHSNTRVFLGITQESVTAACAPLRRRVRSLHRGVRVRQARDPPPQASGARLRSIQNDFLRGLSGERNGDEGDAGCNRPSDEERAQPLIKIVAAQSQRNDRVHQKDEIAAIRIGKIICLCLPLLLPTLM
jgi:hypothetical protein